MTLHQRLSPLLRERSLGVFEGEYKDEISANPKYEKYFNDPNFKDFRHSFSQKRLKEKVMKMYINA